MAMWSVTQPSVRKTRQSGTTGTNTTLGLQGRLQGAPQPTQNLSFSAFLARTSLATNGITPKGPQKGNSCQGERPPVPTGPAPVADSLWEARSPPSSLASTEKRQGGGAWGHSWGWVQDLPFDLLSCSCDHPPRTTDAPA